MIRLQINTEGKERLVALSDPVISIGRAGSNQVVLEDTAASRMHCRIEIDGDTYKVVDNASENGIQVNSQTVNVHRLAVGDLIKVGNSLLRVLEIQTAARPSRRRPAMDPDAERPPRRKRARAKGGQTEAVITVAVALAILVGLLYAMRGQWTAGTEQGVLHRADRLRNEGDFEGALAILQEIPASSSRADDARVLRDQIVRQRDQTLREAAEAAASLDFQRLQKWMTMPDETRDSLLRRIDRFLDEHGRTSYARQAEALRSQVEFRGGGAPPGGNETPVAAGSPLERVLADADALAKKRQFQAALELLKDFYFEREGTEEATRADEKMTEIREASERAWAEVTDAVKIFLDRGKVDEARSLLKEVVSTWGVPHLVAAARQELAGLPE